MTDTDGKSYPPPKGDALDRLRAALACGLVPDEQVGPLLDLLDVLRRAGGAEDRGP